MDVASGKEKDAWAADRFFEDPPFPPAAERCALACELSIEAALMMPAPPVTAWNIASQRVLNETEPLERPNASKALVADRRLSRSKLGR